MKSELLEKLSPEVREEMYDTLYDILCRKIITMLKDSIENDDLILEEIQSAREFAEVKADSDAAKELLETLDSDEVKKAADRVVD